MNSFVSGLAIIAASLTSAVSGRAGYLVDQANDAFYPSLFQNGQHFALGQSFTPTFRNLNFFDLFLEDFGNPTETGGQVYVNIRDGGVAGPIIGTSIVDNIPASFSGIAPFVFPGTVSLTPGDSYVLEIVNPVGDPFGVGSSGLPSSTYGGGFKIFDGIPQPDDLWFVEGVFSPNLPAHAAIPAGTVPEPPTILLLGFGLAALSNAHNRLGKKM